METDAVKDDPLLLISSSNNCLFCFLSILYFVKEDKEEYQITQVFQQGGPSGVPTAKVTPMAPKQAHPDMFIKRHDLTSKLFVTI